MVSLAHPPTNRKLLSILLALTAAAGLAVLCSSGPAQEPQAGPQKEMDLPLGYSLDSYSIEKILDIPCTRNAECRTPLEFAIVSRCPMKTLCLNNQCTVVCPGFRQFKTGDWRTYKNESYRFEIAHPPEWGIEDNLKENSCCLNLFNSREPYSGDSLRKEVMKAQFQHHRDPSIGGKQAYIDKLLGGDPIDPIPPIRKDSIVDLQTKAGTQAIKFSGGVGDLGYVLALNPDFSDVIYVIVWHPDPAFETVISTFRLGHE